MIVYAVGDQARHPALLTPAPADLRRRAYAALQVHALYCAEPHQATISATITDQTPGIIQALLDNPRTDHAPPTPHLKTHQ